MNTLLKILAIVLFPSIVFAYDVKVNMTWQEPSAGQKPTFYMIYMCDKPIKSAWLGENKPQSGPVGKCDGNMQIDRVEKPPATVLYKTELDSGMIFVRITSGIEVPMLDGTKTNWESDLSNEIIESFIARVVIKPPVSLKTTSPDQATIKLSIDLKAAKP